MSNLDQQRENSPIDSTLAAFHPNLPLKFGVMGGAGSSIHDEHLSKAVRLGTSIANAGCITITGACPGLPLAAARGAKQAGGTVIGISPALSLDEHAYKYQSPTLAHDVLIFTGSGLMGREVVNIRSSDIVVIVGGSSGTLGELAIAYDEGKLIGVLTQTGGISDLVHEILSVCNKDTGAHVVYESDPEVLVEQLLKIYRTEHFRHPSVFCRGPDPTENEQADGSHRDIVCGMWVKPGMAAARRTRSGQRLVFCSLACAEKFDANPQMFSLNQSADE
ncbi:YHS domain-containing protein [Stieleria mannarensis]|uniref:SLOG cluster 4 domain-containing protein n=1 Tax=Stieleria mannarensis TaxID=2755585 RepID=UPI0016022C13|nr:YHS domain-containing protein [Rhodopirellula sp. JC639]